MKRKKGYIGEEEARAAAEEGLEAALKCSIKHWEEIAAAPMKDLKSQKLVFGETTCALCHFFDVECYACVLEDVQCTGLEGDSPYLDAEDKYYAWLSAFNRNSDAAELAEYEKEWRKAAMKMVTIMKERYKAAFAKKGANKDRK